MMKFKSIFIANLSEVARSLVKLMAKKKAEAEIWEDHWLSDRFLFVEKDDRILVTPVPIDEVFLKDSSGLMGYKNTLNWWPNKVGESICEAILNDKSLITKLTKIFRQNPGIIVNSYSATKEFLNLVDFLKKQGLDFLTPEIPEEKNLWATDFFDSKAGFRQIVSFLGQNFPSMPQGAICANLNEAIDWACYLVKNTAGCVIKTNRGLAGAGLRIIKSQDMKDKKDVRRKIEKIFKSEPYWQEEILVVEEFIEPDLSVAGGAPNIELRIDQNGVHPLYVCGMRITPEGVFRGVEIGKGAVPDKIGRKLIDCGVKFGEFLEKFGYRGFFEIDFVYGKGRIFPIEANLRRTGGTHVYELGKRLLGNNFIDNYYIVANNIVEAPRFKGKSYKFVKELLKPFLYPIQGKKEGVILTIINLLKKGQLGYVIIGADKSRTEEIENEFLKKLNGKLPLQLVVKMGVC